MNGVRWPFRRAVEPVTEARPVLTPYALPQMDTLHEAATAFCAAAIMDGKMSLTTAIRLATCVARFENAENGQEA